MYFSTAALALVVFFVLQARLIESSPGLSRRGSCLSRGCSRGNGEATRLEPGHLHSQRSAEPITDAAAARPLGEMMTARSSSSNRSRSRSHSDETMVAGSSSSSSSRGRSPSGVPERDNEGPRPYLAFMEQHPDIANTIVTGLRRTAEREVEETHRWLRWYLHQLRELMEAQIRLYGEGNHYRFVTMRVGAVDLARLCFRAEIRVRNQIARAHVAMAHIEPGTRGEVARTQNRRLRDRLRTAEERFNRRLHPMPWTFPRGAVFGREEPEPHPLNHQRERYLDHRVLPGMVVARLQRAWRGHDGWQVLLPPRTLAGPSYFDWAWVQDQRWRAGIEGLTYQLAHLDHDFNLYNFHLADFDPDNPRHRAIERTDNVRRIAFAMRAEWSTQRPSLFLRIAP